MSSAHRPTFAAAKGRAPSAHASQQITTRELPSHSSLKFRQPATEPSQRRDLKRDLELAEWSASNRKRAKHGLDPLPAPTALDTQSEPSRRQSALALALELDADSDDDDDDDDEEEERVDQAKDTEPSEAEAGKADGGVGANEASDAESSSSSSSDSASDADSDDDEDEDEEAALLRELAKIKAERAAQAARRAAADSAADTLSHEEQVAAGNPLLNLQAAFSSTESPSAAPSGGAPAGALRGAARGSSGDFGVQRRWDDDVIFKNQAAPRPSASTDKGFVNDLTRSDFHKKFMNRYIK